MSQVKLLMQNCANNLLQVITMPCGKLFAPLSWSSQAV